ncbi:MAG: hypothetical protein ACPHRO_13595 [Nannocystaceae bacterium]
MQRSRSLLVSLTAGLLLATSVGCGKKAVDPISLVPEGAIAAGGVSVGKFLSAAPFAKYKDEILKDEEGKTFMTSLTTCKLDPAKDAKLLVALADDQKAMVVVKSKGVGVEANLKCMLDNTKAEASEAKLGETSGKKALIIGDGEATCLLASADVLACSSKNWTAKVVEILDGKGKSAAAGSLKPALTNADMAKPLWFSASVAGELAESVKGTPWEKSTAVAGSLDLDETGIAVAVNMGLATPEDAAALAKTLNDQLAQLVPLAPLAGVPKPVAESVKVAAAGSNVEGAAAATYEELDAINNQLQGMMP